ncbi:hypothetical protein TNCT_106461 [Trichonephila clavata]|uniref:Uncharacterized protein n=1 Tax=Trichonephila clavata TaxID=2740835 RepID=A0A8X6IVL3_TRICU|nr:hypothetical protein TNCT_106461 [Trichonephila clavata]
MDIERFTDCLENSIPSILQHLEYPDRLQKAMLILNNEPTHPNKDILKSGNENISVKYLYPYVTGLIKVKPRGPRSGTQSAKNLSPKFVV